MKRNILLFFLILIYSTSSAYANDAVLGGSDLSEDCSLYELAQLSSKAMPIIKEESEIQNKSAIRDPKDFFFPSFLLFNGGIVILILVLYWNIKRR